jgi:AcrR family transcriptional regulator
MKHYNKKCQRILQAATELFLDHGVDGTTLAMVGKASKTVVGTVRHFFGKKSQLAASVYDHMAGRLTEDARAALDSRDTDVAAAIRALLSACLKWPVNFPHYRRLIGMLDVYPSTKAQIRTDRVPERLAKVLGDWAGELESNRIARLSPSELYAVVLAPAMCATTPVIGPPSDNDESSVEWLEVLTAAALTAITPPNDKPQQPFQVGPAAEGRRQRSASPKREGGQGSLFR